MPLAHIGIHTKDIEKLSAFYLAALKPLGYKEQISILDGKVRGYGAPFCGPDFWLSAKPGETPPGFENKSQGEWGGPLHLAFTAKTRNQVRAFYEAAIAAGATCNGPPGPRPQYFVTYYGAFVFDPEGRNIEATCLAPAFWAEEWGVKIWLGLLTVLLGGVGFLVQKFFLAPDALPIHIWRP